MCLLYVFPLFVRSEQMRLFQPLLWNWVLLCAFDFGLLSLAQLISLLLVLVPVSLVRMPRNFRVAGSSIPGIEVRICVVLLLPLQRSSSGVYIDYDFVSV